MMHRAGHSALQTTVAEVYGEAMVGRTAGRRRRGNRGAINNRRTSCIPSCSGCCHEHFSSSSLYRISLESLEKTFFLLHRAALLNIDGSFRKRPALMIVCSATLSDDDVRNAVSAADDLPAAPSRSMAVSVVAPNAAAARDLKT